MSSAEVAASSGRCDPTIIGWREWIAVPTWGIEAIKAKVDTGARTSALHVVDAENFDRDGQRWVRFGITPWQANDHVVQVVEAPRIDHRTITSSSGTKSHRPVVAAELVVAGRRLNAEITLTDRSGMGFRMLLGREALKQGFVVDSAASYLGGRPPKSIRHKNRGRQ